MGLKNRRLDTNTYYIQHTDTQKTKIKLTQI